MAASDRTEAALRRFMREYGIHDREHAMRRIVQDWLAGAGYFSDEPLPKVQRGLATVERDDRDMVQYPEFRDGDGGPGSGG